MTRFISDADVLIRIRDPSGNLELMQKLSGPFSSKEKTDALVGYPPTGVGFLVEVRLPSYEANEQRRRLIKVRDA